MVSTKALVCCLVIVLAGCSAPAGPPGTPSQSTTIAPDQTTDSQSTPTSTAKTTTSPSTTTPPTPTTTLSKPEPVTATITVDNPLEGEYTVSVWAVPESATSFVISYADGTTTTVRATSIATLPQGSLTNATALRPTNAVGGTDIDATGRSQTQSELSDIPANSTIIYAVFRQDADEFRLGGSFRCERVATPSLQVVLNDETTAVIRSNC